MATIRSAQWPYSSSCAQWLALILVIFGSNCLLTTSGVTQDIFSPRLSDFDSKACLGQGRGPAPKVCSKPDATVSLATKLGTPGVREEPQLQETHILIPMFRRNNLIKTKNCFSLCFFFSIKLYIKLSNGKGDLIFSHPPSPFLLHLHHL